MIRQFEATVLGDVRRRGDTGALHGETKNVRACVRNLVAVGQPARKTFRSNERKFSLVVRQHFDFDKVGSHQLGEVFGRAPDQRMVVLRRQRDLTKLGNGLLLNGLMFRSLKGALEMRHIGIRHDDPGNTILAGSIGSDAAQVRRAISSADFHLATFETVHH